MRTAPGRTLSAAWAAPGSRPPTQRPGRVATPWMRASPISSATLADETWRLVTASSGAPDLPASAVVCESAGESQQCGIDYCVGVQNPCHVGGGTAWQVGTQCTACREQDGGVDQGQYHGNAGHAEGSPVLRLPDRRWRAGRGRDRRSVVHAMGNIEFPFADSPAGVSSCMTSQCSTILPLSMRKMSTATISFGPQPR